MFAEVLYLKASVGSTDVRDLLLSFVFFPLSCLVEICLDKLHRRGEMSWSFQGLLGIRRQLLVMSLSQWAWPCCFGVQSVVQPRYGANGIAPRHQWARLLPRGGSRSLR